MDDENVEEILEDMDFTIDEQNDTDLSGSEEEKEVDAELDAAAAEDEAAEEMPDEPDEAPAGVESPSDDNPSEEIEEQVTNAAEVASLEALNALEGKVAKLQATYDALQDQLVAFITNGGVVTGDTAPGVDEINAVMEQIDAAEEAAKRLEDMDFSI